MYDGQIGRFFTQDKFADKYYTLNPYNYAANDPNNLIDIKGDSIWFSFQYNKAGELSDVTMNVTGRVINLSDRNVDMEEAISDISSGISNTFQGAIRVNGNEVSFQTNVQLLEATSIDQVKDSDHLIVLANASGKEGDARGAANMLVVGQCLLMQMIFQQKGEYLAF